MPNWFDQPLIARMKNEPDNAILDFLIQKRNERLKS